MGTAKKIILLSIMFGCLFPGLVSGQTAIRVLTLKDLLPLEGVLVHYRSLLHAKGKQGVLFTDKNGSVALQLEEKSLVYIHYLGYESIFDTLAPGAKAKEYKLAAVNKTLDDVVVTGQYEMRSAEQSAYKVKIIDSKRIEKQAAMNLASLLSNELNIRVSNDAFLGSSMSLQGISGQNIKILMDGVPLIGRLNGSIDLSQVNLSNVERVEIIEGPMSVVYGSDALGGVVNVITKKTFDPSRRFSVNTYYETVGHYNADARAGFNIGKTKLMLGGGRYFFSGFSPNDSGRVKVWKPKEQVFADLQYVFKLGKSDHRFYSQLLKEKLISRGAATITPFEAYAYDDFYISYRSTHAMYSDFHFKNNAHVSLINAFSTYSRQRETYRRNLLNQEDRRINNNDQQDTNSFYHILGRGTYNTGNIWKKVNFQAGYDVNYELGKGRRLSGNTQEMLDVAFFSSAEYKPIGRLLLRPGLRAAWNNNFSVPLLPTLHVKYELLKNLALRGSYARGYRAPSLKELNLFFVDINHNVQGNSQLQAERSDNYQLNISLQQRNEKKVYKLDAGIFYNQLFNMISLALHDSSSNLYGYVNIDRFYSKGLTISAEIRSEIYTFNAGVSFVGRSSGFGDTLTSTFLYSPEFRVNFIYTIPRIKVDLSLFYKYNGEQLAYAMNGHKELYQTRIDAFSMLDMNLGKYFFSKKVYLALGLKNMLNVQNVNSNVASGPHQSAAGQMLAATGRGFFVNLKWNFGWKKNG